MILTYSDAHSRVKRIATIDDVDDDPERPGWNVDQRFVVVRRLVRGKLRTTLIPISRVLRIDR